MNCVAVDDPTTNCDAPAVDSTESFANGEVEPIPTLPLFFIVSTALEAVGFVASAVEFCRNIKSPLFQPKEVSF